MTARVILLQLIKSAHCFTQNLLTALHFTQTKSQSSQDLRWFSLTSFPIPSSSPLSHITAVTVTSLLFPEYSRCIPASVSSYLLFPVGFLAAASPVSGGLLLKCHPLSKAHPDPAVQLQLQLPFPASTSNPPYSAIVSLALTPVTHQNIYLSCVLLCLVLPHQNIISPWPAISIYFFITVSQVPRTVLSSR